MGGRCMRFTGSPRLIHWRAMRTCQTSWTLTRATRSCLVRHDKGSSLWEAASPTGYSRRLRSPACTWRWCVISIARPRAPRLTRH